MGIKVRAVLVPTGEEPRAIEIEDALEAKQRLVDGWIGILSCRGDGLEFIVNEEGLFKKEPNRAIFANQYMADERMQSQVCEKEEPVSLGDLFTVLHGDFIVMKYDDEKEAYVDMSDGEIKSICEEFADPKTGADAETLLSIGWIWRQVG